MKGSCIIYGKNLEYDFISGWIKYMRIKNGISQKALSYGICSKSYLSFFENGKRTLSEDAIEALLKKFHITNLDEIENIGAIRQRLYELRLDIEDSNRKNAENIYKELCSMEDFINNSLYNIEFKVYKLYYLTFANVITYDEFKASMNILDKILPSLDDNLRYLYLLATAKCIYRFEDHKEGINRMLLAYNIHNTPFINFQLGFCYCFDNQSVKGTYYLNLALDSYDKYGRYINAVFCHNYLSICYMNLKIYDSCETHLKAALNGANYFNMNKVLTAIYINLSNYYYIIGNYKDSIKWSEKSMTFCHTYNPEFELLAANNYVNAFIKEDHIDFIFIKDLIKKYLKDENKSSRYYNLLYFDYLKLFHFKEEIFYKEVTEVILPFYKKINYIQIYTNIELALIDYLENKRRYKEANKIYKEILKDKL